MTQITDPVDTKKRVVAALELLDQTTTTKAKFESIRTLIKGINPSLDTTLEHCSTQWAQIEKMQTGAVIELGLEQLPEHTEEEKKRKKAILLLLRYIKQLKAEVERVKKELDATKHQGKHSQSGVSAWGKIINFAKGPLGITTIIAVAAVATLHTIATDVVITNKGCQSLNVNAIPVPLPGLMLPKEPISNGDSGVATVPPLTVTVDNSSARTMTVKTIGMTKTFDVSGMTFTFDGQSLSGTTTEIHLSDKKKHELIVQCR